MAIFLLDDTLKVEVFYEPSDRDFDDDICLSITETCPDEERLFRADETNMYLTPEQARRLGLALLNAAEKSCEQCDWIDEE
jgi:hypothetical protein